MLLSWCVRWTLFLGVPLVCAAQCREAPTVQMDERTAESHLLAKKDPEPTARGGRWIRLRRVVVLVTVDRKGVICDVRPVEGPKQLQPIAVKTVKKYWKYRPFLVNWKPVVAQFPVSVTFVDPSSEPELKANLPRGMGCQGKQAYEVA